MTGFEKLICKYDMARFFLVSCSDDSGWLPDYQTLIVGILPLVVGFMGLLVAWMTLRQLSKQVNAQNQQLELQKQAQSARSCDFGQLKERIANVQSRRS